VSLINFNLVINDCFHACSVNNTTTYTMAWIIVSPSSIHDVCSLLGFVSSTGEYKVNAETCDRKFEKLNECPIYL